MKYQTFYDLMDLYRDDGIELDDPDLTDADRITALTMEKLGPVAVPAQRRKRPLRRMVTAIAAAALALGLSVTAYAVYQSRVADYIIPEPTATADASHEASNEASPEAAVTETTARASLSLVGYQGTPEYAAYVEWTDYLAQADPVDYNAMGVDDTWHETPDNYAYYYQAYTRERADKLDEIMAKYDLRLHESRTVLNHQQDLYNALGIEPFLSEKYDNTGGYIYNDGTFKLDFCSDWGDGGDLNDIFVSVKGTITSIFAVVDPTLGMEEWSYETASGQVVDLVLTPLNAHIFYETEAAYVHVNSVMTKQATAENPNPVAPSHTRESLEALADSIDFGILEKRFGNDFSAEQTEAQVAAYAAALENATDTYNRDDTVDEAIAAIGDFYLADLPEGYSMYIVTSFLPDDGGLGHYHVTRRYQGHGGEIVFSWSDWDGMSASLEADSMWSYLDVPTEHTTVNGYDAILETVDDNIFFLTWVDTTRQLKFMVEGWWDVSQEELLAIAESVTEQ